ncbi:MAG: hypothetical protein GC172_01395 [Phycisphaera sp.]|nr:hypothetical protein [Phycisphaera sp.]
MDSAAFPRPASGQCRALALAAALGLAALVAGFATGCDSSAGGLGALFARTGGESFVARRAALAIWYDKRPSGSIIKHGLLVLDSPARASGSYGGEGKYLVTAAPAVFRKIDDVLGNRLPVQKGIPLTFAVGEPAPVRIERIGPRGSRELVQEGRVAFLEVVCN